ncbi:hypothetical protein GCM10008179_19360 [Hansschlegelia plantiphila]|uniref:Uncharacterized protein n=1 Tax=Hansschlegelia plantiphila TaxID=374655 RepID=A0A9W6J222_9HYPH|nr:hypothetical protein GCM10008179_19360 [Hansschlegelia plantiphila]
MWQIHLRRRPRAAKGPPGGRLSATRDEERARAASMGVARIGSTTPSKAMRALPAHKNRGDLTEFGCAR